jgi:hypothetical protein
MQGGWWASLMPRLLYSRRDRESRVRWMGWVGPIASLDFMEKGKICFPCRDSNHELSPEACVNFKAITNLMHKYFIHIILQFCTCFEHYYAHLQEVKLYTGCPEGNVPDFGRMFLTLKYTDVTQTTYIRSWTVTEIMARERSGLLAVPRTVPVSRDALPVHYACPSFSLQPGHMHSRCDFVINVCHCYS